MFNKIKKIGAVLIIASICVAMLTSCGIGGDEEGRFDELFENLSSEFTREFAGTTINVFNWAHFISSGEGDTLDVLAAFTELTGIRVNYEMFDTNENMHSRVASGAVAYDVLIPSDYMIERLRNEELLQPLNFDMIPNYHYIDEYYRNLYFDENNEYSVPYFTGFTGIVYNSTMVNTPVESWEIMWNEDYADMILTFDNSRDAFAIAQFLLGQDVNTTNTDDWDAAAELLMEQNAVLQARVQDQIYNKMPGRNAAIGAWYNGSVVTMMEENDELRFAFPREGVNRFVDSMVVPANAGNFEGAMKFINFMLEPQVALANAEYVRYATPNRAVRENPEYSLRDNVVLYPASEDRPQYQWFRDIDVEVRDYYEALWRQVIRD